MGVIKAIRSGCRETAVFSGSARFGRATVPDFRRLQRRSVHLRLRDHLPCSESQAHDPSAPKTATRPLGRTGRKPGVRHRWKTLLTYPGSRATVRARARQIYEWRPWTGLTVSAGGQCYRCHGQNGLTLQEKVLAGPLAWAFDLTKASRDWSVVPAKLPAFWNAMG